MSTMKRIVLCISLFFLEVPAMAGGVEQEGDAAPASVSDGSKKAEQPVEESPLLDRVLSQMDSSYRTLQSFRADFEQESETKTFQRKSRASGKVYFLKPSEMRWSYLQPEVREVYLSGEKMTVYLPGRNQVIEQELTDAMQGVAPARLFMGVEELVSSFFVSMDCGDGSDEDAYCLRLAPRQREAISVEEILLWVGKKDFLPLRTESRDVLGNRTTLSFRNRERNIPLKEELFRFAPPADAERIDPTF